MAPSGQSKSPALPTQQMIAQKAGVSREAVSHILGGKLTHRYHLETQERVRAIAKELNYRPNRTAQIMRKGRSNLIGIVHYNSTSETARKTVAYLPRVISEMGYDYLVIDLQWMGGDIERVFNELVQARVEGVIVLAYSEMGFTDRHTAIFKSAGIPVVSLYGDDGLNIPVVCGNVQHSFSLLTRHLWENGHRRVVQIADKGQHRNTRERIAGFTTEISGYGVSHVIMDAPEFFRQWPQLSKEQRIAITVRLDLKHYNHDFVEANYQFGKRLFSGYALPDVLLAYNDRSAFGIFTAAWELGLKIPEDVALTGDDDDAFGKYPIYQLTTLRHSIEESCTVVGDLLSRSLKGEKTEGIRYQVDRTIIKRRSCALPRSQATPVSPSEPS